MAIQTINDALPTGDNPRQINKKINENFALLKGAAYYSVGMSNGQIPVNSSAGVSDTGWASVHAPRVGAAGELTRSSLIRSGIYRVSTSSFGVGFLYSPLIVTLASDTFSAYAINQTSLEMRLYGGPRANLTSTDELDYAKVYTSKNTDEDSTNGFLKPSSPILKIEADRMWGNDDGDKMGATYTRKGVGDYEIAGTTGIRDDGWYIEIPNDINGNPKVAVTLETGDDGVVHLKTYKRVFNLQTSMFEPDLDNPMDITEGRWIDLRFNDLPEEPLDEPELETEKDE